MSSPLMYGTPSSRVEGTPRSGVRGTPARQRPDLGSVRKAPQVDLHSEPVSLLLVATRSSDPRFKRGKLKKWRLLCFDSQAPMALLPATPMRDSDW